MWLVTPSFLYGHMPLITFLIVNCRDWCDYFFRSVSYTGNRHPIPGDRAPTVTMIGWHGTALGCRRRGVQATGPRGCSWVANQTGVDV